MTNAMTMVLLLQWKGALKLEILGMRHSSGRSVYAHVKRTLGFRGDKKKVLAQLEAHIAAVQQAAQEAQ